MAQTASAPPKPGIASELAALLEEQPGGRYLRADLQVHTPIDKAFERKPPPTRADERRALAAEYLGAARAQGIELVGITEHNDVSWIDDLRYAAHELEMYLLPGFEVESQEGIHVLCLFDPDTPVSHLEDCLARLSLTKEKRKRQRLELRADRAFGDLIRFVQDECGGMCIAAHIEGSKGLLAALREGARVDAWKTRELLAAQVSKPPDQIKSGNGRIIRNEEPIYRREQLPAYILTSDARSFETIGTVSTWVKMDQVGIEGLRQAFLDPESRIAYGDPAAGRQGARLLAARWEGGFLDGIGFPLNSELNTLIGGKGTGKSTVIETIRYAFDLEYRTDDVRQAASTLLQYAFRSGSKVSLVIETDAPARRRYIIERTAPHAPVVRDELGQLQPDLDPLGLVQPCVYGQKEIFGIAQNPPALLVLLDGFAEQELRTAREREEQLLKQCSESARFLIDTQRRIDEAEERLAELPNLVEWRDRFKQAGFDKLLRERRQLDREERLLHAAAAAIDERLEALSRLVAPGERLARTLELAGGEEELPNMDLLIRGHELLEQADQRWSAAVSDLHADLEQTMGALRKILSEWATRREARAAEFDRALRELQERMPDVDPERYLDVERRIEQLTPLREALDGLRQRFEQARKERSQLLVELEETRAEKYRIRERAAKRLNDGLSGALLVEVTYRGARDSFVERLTELRTGARNDALKRLVGREDFTPAAFAAAVRSRSLATEFGVPAGQANQLERALSEETLLDLATAELPDRVELKLDIALGDGRDYRRLEALSPGQRSTAILLLIMQESKDPLLVDQPEDDLDNRFIYDDIVKRLRAAKPIRQFLVATHNANIPVLGDAEQIVALDARETDGGPVRGVVRARGSIDASHVREAAEEILEGGREAFALRQAKYSM